MNGSQDLDYLLREANPVLDPETYVFVCRESAYGDNADWHPIATFLEDEGLTMVIRRNRADQLGLEYDGAFRRITLQVHSSLNAVGLTAKFSQRLSAHGISANVIAAFYHDHIFVPAADANRAMSALTNLEEG